MNEVLNQYNPYQQNMFTPTRPTYQSTVTSSSNNGLMTIFVNSEDEVSHYPVAAGLTVLLISFNLKKFWLKGTDTSGIPSQIRTFTFDETTPMQAQTENVNYVTKSEFEALNSKLDKLLSDLGGK